MNLYVKLPEMWCHVLNVRRATAADWNIAVELLRLAKFSSAVKFSNIAAAKLGISRQTKWRSLARLGSWGLIDFSGRPGASPKVTVKWLAGRQPRDG